MRFVDLLKATVVANAAAATGLATLTVLAAAADDRAGLVAGALAWWVLAGALGAWLGRRAETTPPIARLLAAARSTTSLPEQQPGTVLLNRLWPLLVATVGAAALSLAYPQVAAVATGFTIIWALSWRHQDAAVTAIEERDGVAFYVERTSPLSPIQLVRTPGFRRTLPRAA